VSSAVPAREAVAGGRGRRRRPHWRSGAAAAVRRRSLLLEFEYCRRVLHLRENEAYLRITVARAARENPVLLDLLRDGRLHLSGIARLAPHLRRENSGAVLERACGMSHREIQEFVRELAPRPDVAPGVRRPPPRPAAGLVAPAQLGAHRVESDTLTVKTQETAPGEGPRSGPPAERKPAADPWWSSWILTAKPGPAARSLRHWLASKRSARTRGVPSCDSHQTRWRCRSGPPPRRRRDRSRWPRRRRRGSSVPAARRAYGSGGTRAVALLGAMVLTAASLACGSPPLAPTSLGESDILLIRPATVLLRPGESVTFEALLSYDPRPSPGASSLTLTNQILEVRPGQRREGWLGSPEGRRWRRVDAAMRSRGRLRHNRSMCHRIRCTRCDKATWAGCGRHVEEALEGVPPEKRCQCPRPKSLLERLLGR
jgi:hypothetical protein